MASLERTIKTLEIKPENSRSWSLERVGIAVAIAVGIGSTIATALASNDAGMQADLSRQALSSNERNDAFADHVEAMSAYCEALDFSKCRSEMTWSFERTPKQYRYVASFKDVGTQFQGPSALAIVHEKLHNSKASAVPLENLVPRQQRQLRGPHGLCAETGFCRRFRSRGQTNGWRSGICSTR